MNISEAIAVLAVTKLLDGTSQRTDADQLLEHVVFLHDRATKTLAAGSDLDQAETRSTLVHLIQRQADTSEVVDLSEEVPC